MIKIFFLAGFLWVTLGGVSGADDILYLKSGQRVQGTITAQSKDSVTIHTAVGLNITYYPDEIESINGNTLVKESPSTDNTPANNKLPPSSDINSAPSGNSSPTNSVEPRVAPSDNKKSTAAQTPKALFANIGKDDRDRILAQYDRDVQARSQGGSGSQVVHFKNSEEYISFQLNSRIAIWTQQFQSRVDDFNKNHPQIFENIPGIHQISAHLGNKQVSFFVFRILPVLYVLICFPLMTIALKLNVSGFWMVWLPILNLWLMVKMGNKSFLYFLGLFIPLVNIFVFIVVWMNIFESLIRPKWLGILMIIPGINIILLWYLAYTKNI